MLFTASGLMVPFRIVRTLEKEKKSQKKKKIIPWKDPILCLTVSQTCFHQGEHVSRSAAI